jgi:hypothetical protein
MEKPVAKPHKNYTKLPIESDPTRSSGLTQFGAESLQLLLAMKLNFTILKPGREKSLMTGSQWKAPAKNTCIIEAY